MKKKLFLLTLLLAMFVPFMVNAKTYYDDYNSLNLVGALTEEQMELQNKNYKESDDQAIIYLFRGNGCGFCRNLLTYLNSLTVEYGKYFKVVSFEVWNDQQNNALMNKVATITNVQARGVPYYIIGDETFDGYNESYNERILNAIMKEYNDPGANGDVFEKLDEKENGGSKGTGADTFAVIFWNFAFVAIGVGVMIYISNKNKNEILEAVKEIKENKTKKKE